MQTNEFSFILQCSKHGVGVFAAHAIAEGSHLRLFADEVEFSHRVRKLDKQAVPEAFAEYCMAREDHYLCPPDFGVMPIGWYLNHSSNPNAHRGKDDSKQSEYQWFALRDISVGEEILIDYNSLEEPEQSKAAYYRQ